MVDDLVHKPNRAQLIKLADGDRDLMRSIELLFERSFIDETTLEGHLQDFDNPHQVQESQIIGLDRMRWVGQWANGDYEKNDTIHFSGWTMVANQNTSEYPIPAPTGSPFNVYQGTIGTTSDVAKQILFGNRYWWPNDGYLTGYRIYTVTGNQYRIFAVDDPLGNPLIINLADFTATSTGWLSFNIPDQIIRADTLMDLVGLVNEPDPTPTTFVGNWNYTKPQNDGAPGAGVAIQSNKTLGLLNVNYIDFDGGDRTAELQALTIGDKIDLDAISWSIQSITDVGGTYIAFGVSPAVQAGVVGVQEFTYHTVTPTPITYALDTDYWTNNDPTIQGLLSIDGDYNDITPDGTAYGADLIVQSATIPEDWEVVSSP